MVTIAQHCGLILLLIIWFFFQFQKKVNLQTEKQFRVALLFSILCLIFDIASVTAIKNQATTPKLFVDYICKTYLVLLICVALRGLLYVCADAYFDTEKYQILPNIFRKTAIVGIIITYVLPISYYCSEDYSIIYSYGPSTIATYIFTFLFIASTLIINYRKRKYILARRREAVSLWMIIWIIAAVVQLFNQHLLIVGYACALGVMIVYLMLENPGSYLVRDTGLFNQNAFIQHLRELFYEGKPFPLNVIVFQHIFERENDSQINEKTFLNVANYLNSLDGVYPFQLSEDEIAILYREHPNIERSAEELKNRLEAGWEFENVLINPNWIYMRDCTIVDTPSDLLYLLRYARIHAEEFTDTNILRLNQEVVEKMQKEQYMEQTLNEAIKNNQVEVYYQPIYSAKDKHFTSAEALVRIRDAAGRLVPPNDFITLAEKNGKIIQLGEMIFKQVCEFLHENDLRQYHFKYIEINLSTVQCSYDYLAADYIRIMKEYDIDPSMINLEITESASLKEKEILLGNMDLLRNYGIKFSLDDFGTGQSNLNYIIDMPVDIVKFDREMSNAYFNNNKARHVMDATIQMIHGMELEIVSEGIETAEQYNTMTDLGINYIQGYYFSKPLPKEQFLEFLQKQQNS